jgi:hypothetical protein
MASKVEPKATNKPYVKEKENITNKSLFKSKNLEPHFI